MSLQLTVQLTVQYSGCKVGVKCSGHCLLLSPPLAMNEKIIHENVCLFQVFGENL